MLLDTLQLDTKRERSTHTIAGRAASRAKCEALAARGGSLEVALRALPGLLEELHKV